MNIDLQERRNRLYQVIKIVSKPKLMQTTRIQMLDFQTFLDR
jgi:hypothetical protein